MRPARTAKRRAPSTSTSGIVDHFTDNSSPPSPGTSSTSTPSTGNSRVTRSAARQAAAAEAGTRDAAITGQAPLLADTHGEKTSSNTRKRKTVIGQDSPEDIPSLLHTHAQPRVKRPRLSGPKTQSLLPSTPATSSRRKKGSAAKAMSNSEVLPGSPTETNAELPPMPTTSSNHKSSRSKKSLLDTPTTSAPGPSSSRRSKGALAAKVDDPSLDDQNEKPRLMTNDEQERAIEDQRNDTNVDDDMVEEDDHDDDDDDPFGNPFASSFLGSGGPPSGISTTLRALSGMMSGMSSRLRDILANLKKKEDPSLQLIALQELSELLLVSTEDNLSGHFAPDQFVKELVILMQPSDFGEENPEMMLLACRCIANLMEALPNATGNVVYGGAVPILCQKLLEIHYIDLAEQALSTLEKISGEFPAIIVREGGLTACLTYLDFFPTSTQRTAVTTAANCCRNIPDESFPVIRDVMPILLNVLGSNDQKVVEQACLCVSRVVESFKYRQDKLEELVSTDLLKAITRLLLPGTTNLIGPDIHTQFLRVLSYTARASPKLSADLFKMNIVDTLYQILTGVSPPSGTEDVASKLDSVVIMQALIHRPREQVFETLNVICELLPGLPRESDPSTAPSSRNEERGTRASAASHKKTPNEQRIKLLEGCREELRRFAIILLPTLSDAFSSTVNLSVRQKVLTAQLKMLSNLDVLILEDALRMVPYASYLASILSQQDHPTLVSAALQAAELLLRRLERVYRYQFYREGVIQEIAKLANPTTKAITKADLVEAEKTSDLPMGSAGSPKSVSREETDTEDVDDVPVGDEEVTSDEEPDIENDGDNDEDDDLQDDITASPTSSHDSSDTSGRDQGSVPIMLEAQDHIAEKARAFMNFYENESHGKEMRDKASKILDNLRTLASNIETFYTEKHNTNKGLQYFLELANSFDGDALDSITSSELLSSGIVRVLLSIFNSDDQDVRSKARSEFVQVFMGRAVTSQAQDSSSKGPVTPFNVLVHKLQDLLSRAEHFEVITVHQNSFDGNRSSPASMLAKQLRLKLIADDESEIPRPYRNVMVSIHAIATFKALDDYLRPRISISAERPSRVHRHPEGISNALAAFAAASGLPIHQQQRITERAASGAGGAASTPAQTPLGAARALRKASKSKSHNMNPGNHTSPQTPAEKPPTARRSSRRHQAQEPPIPPVSQEVDRSQDPLECADERQIGEDEEELDPTGALESIVDDLEDEMAEDAPHDPSAVSLEVASTGKITARKEDGTRVATPSQALGATARTPPSFQEAVAAGPAATPTHNTRHLTYAAAVQAAQDWHIEFSIADKPISNESTIYGAVHNNLSQTEDPVYRNVWSSVHSVKYKRVPGPAHQATTLTPVTEVAPLPTPTGLPKSLDNNPSTSAILRLLNILHALNANLDDVLAENKTVVQLQKGSLAQFVNTKLTAKLNRQLEEPLIVASNCLPSWSEDLARLYPFLFPFETRHLFLQSTSFGYSRSMARWQSAQATSDSRQSRHRDDRPFLGRLQRQKVRISRSRILESALKVMELYGASPSVLEVEYFEEVGTGLGPTLEFYSTVSKEFSKKKIKLWRENEAGEGDEFAFGKRGLFPAPLSPQEFDTENGKKLLHLFKMLGKFVARSMIDSRIIDISFNPTFFRISDGPLTVPPSLATVKTVDETLARSLRLVKQFANAKRLIDEDTHLTKAEKAAASAAIQVEGVHVEDLGLDFTLPGYPSIELQPNGSNIPVNIDNVGLFIDRVIDLTLGSGVQRQIDAFRAGFSIVFPYSALKAFTPDELVMLFGRVEEDWTLETLMDSIKADHGFNMDSKSVKNLLQAMSELSPPDRRDFLQFVTGSPKLPIGGFKSLTPMFTVVCKPSEPPYTSDDYLPSVMTCVNYLKLPDYTDLKTMRERLGIAIKEGQGAFHLS